MMWQLSKQLCITAALAAVMVSCNVARSDDLKLIPQGWDAALAGDEPVHVHCIMNWRVTAFFYLIDRAGGVPEAEARARMAAVGNPLEDENAPPVWRALLA